MKITVLFSASLVALALATNALANDSATAPDGGDKGNGKKVSLTGEAKCAKCILHEGSACQTVIQTTDKGKVVTYYVTENEVAKGFHEDVCTAPHKVKATGFVKEVGGKQQLTLTKISADEK
jgi:hypothetical protein